MERCKGGITYGWKEKRRKEGRKKIKKDERNQGRRDQGGKGIRNDNRRKE